MKRMVPALLGLALLLFCNRARAQSPTEPSPETKAEAWSQLFFEEGLLRSCEDPTLESAIALPRPQLTLEETDEGGTKLKARVGLRFTEHLVGSLEVKSPKSSSGETTLASTDGLSKGSSGELKLSWFRHKYEIMPETVQGIDPEEKSNRASWTDWTAEKKAAYEEMKEVLSSDNTKAVENGDAKWRVTDYLDSVLARPSGKAAAGPKRYDEALAAYRHWIKVADPMIPVYTIRLNADQKDFDFVVPSAGPPAGLKKTSESHTNYKATASVGAYFWGTVYSSLNYSRGTEFQAGSKKDFCAPAGLAGVLQCETLTIAPPRRERTEILEFEARGLAGDFGFGGHVTHDLRSNVTIVEVPVYLLQKLGTSKMELNLGARARWRSDTKDYSLSVFIGPALSSVLRMFDPKKAK